MARGEKWAPWARQRLPLGYGGGDPGMDTQLRS